jgi:hypothetical protein
MTMRRAGSPAWWMVPLLFAGAEARAADFDVPGTHATLQLAVAAAAASPDVDNTITLSVSPLTTGASVDIGAAFGPTRHLLIRPAPALPRASLVNTTPGVTIVSLASAANVTIQDLDILRNITNNEDIVTIDVCEDIVLERCRIGSNWSTGGTPGWACVRLTYPTNVLLRNNICFARVPGTFDYGIHAGSFNDPANALRLYNNLVSDYRVYGIRIEGAVAGALILLRNNVAVNYTNLNPEPIAYRSDVLIGGPTVVSSHNSSFATAGFIQSIAVGSQGIAGPPADFVSLTKGDAVAAYSTRLWTAAPPWDANANLYRIVAGGALHDDAGDFGITVATAFDDIAVTDDIEKQFRPGGTPPHTDRGPDQLEIASTSATDERPEPDDALTASARWTAGGRLAVDFHARVAGRLELVIVDVAGRKRQTDGREVSENARGRFSWDASPAALTGPLFYRLLLYGVDGSVSLASGRIDR